MSKLFRCGKYYSFHTDMGQFNGRLDSIDVDVFVMSKTLFIRKMNADECERILVGNLMLMKKYIVWAHLDDHRNWE